MLYQYIYLIFKIFKKSGYFFFLFSFKLIQKNHNVSILHTHAYFGDSSTALGKIYGIFFSFEFLHKLSYQICFIKKKFELNICFNWTEWGQQSFGKLSRTNLIYFNNLAFNVPVDISGQRVVSPPGVVTLGI